MTEIDYSKATSKLSEEERAEIDKAMEFIYTRGFSEGYAVGRGDLWILADKDTPQTDEQVDVTVELADGIRRTSVARHRGSRWYGGLSSQGTVVAWRPKSEPFYN